MYKKNCNSYSKKLTSDLISVWPRKES